MVILWTLNQTMYCTFRASETGRSGCLFVASNCVQSYGDVKHNHICLYCLSRQGLGDTSGLVFFLAEEYSISSGEQFTKESSTSKAYNG